MKANRTLCTESGRYVEAILILLMMVFSGTAFSCQKDSSFVIGTYHVTKVTDGDTFRFDKLDRPARLLCIDTEETFKTQDAEQQTEEIAKNWEAFYLSQKRTSKFPVKADSPLGFEAWKWAEDFFRNVDYVRLEREDDDRAVDIYGRYLVYVIAVMKDGSEVNYNIECVRNGYSPYFNKYGNSRRFHDEFVAAQEFARSKNLGVWDPAKMHYPDYPERLVWWQKRADQLDNFQTKHAGDPDYFDIGSERDFKRLGDNVGKTITVFGSISDVMTKDFPYILRIPRTKDEALDLVIFEKHASILESADIETKKEYYIYATGKIEVYKGRYEIVIDDANQIRVE